MTKHTLGPWELEGEDILGADGYPVAELSLIAIRCDYVERFGVNHWAEAPGKAYIERPIEEVEANGHLIKSAPDLLKACKLAYNVLLQVKESLPWGNLLEHPMAVIQAAIDRAEGRS